MKIPGFIVLCLFLFWDGSSGHLQNNLIQKYELSANASKVLQRDDRRIMRVWADEYQVKRLDVSLRYRMQMVKHEEHSFKNAENVKWMECMFVHRKDIRRSKRFYHENELECLRTSTSRDADKKEDVELIDKQITNWRKGYRYLMNRCEMENPVNKTNAEQCLIEYMQNDKYDEVIERLMLLKQSSISELYAHYDSTLDELEECLKSQLSRYLERVRHIMDTLNKCYSITS